MAQTVTYDIVRGMVGTDVARLQEFLNASTGSSLVLDGVYGRLTTDAVDEFQRMNGLGRDGQFSGATLKKGRDKGFAAVEYTVTDKNSGANWPKKPTNLNQPNAGISQHLFGSFQFRHTPVRENFERIEILGNWRQQNIVSYVVPQLKGVVIPIRDAHAVRSNGDVTSHRDAKPVILRLFAEWERAGLIPKLLTWYGCWNARLKRGATRPVTANLSNHSWGSALDINAPQNWLRQVPALMGARGCVREFVEIANDLGVYWGGHFGSPKDGMHFEIARL